MNLKKTIKHMPSVNLIPLSFSRFRENMASLTFPVLSDILFLFLYGFVIIGLIGERLFSTLVSFGIEISSSESQVATLSDAILQESAKPLLIRSSILAALMIVSFYVLYCIFQGFSWWWCRKMSSIDRKQTGFASYLKEFSRVNIFWVVILMIYNALIFLRDFLSAEETAPSVFFTMLFLAILYFALISYSLLPNTSSGNIRKTLRFGVIRLYELLPAILIVSIIFVAVDFLLNLAYGVSNSLFIFLGIFVFIPCLSWARIYSMMVINSLHKEESR